MSIGVSLDSYFEANLEMRSGFIGGQHGDEYSPKSSTLHQIVISEV